MCSDLERWLSAQVGDQNRAANLGHQALQTGLASCMRRTPIRYPIGGILSVIAIYREIKIASEPPAASRAAKRLEGHESIAGKQVLCLYRAVAGFA